MVKIGIIGAGRMGKIHAKSISQIPQAKLVGVFDTNPKTAEDLALKFNTKVFAEENNIINHPEIDTVIIATPTIFHANTIIKAAENEKNIFCEKPLARTLKEAEKIAKIIEKTKINFGIGFNMRFSWPQKKIKELIPLLGKPKSARISNVHPSYNRKKGEWYADFQSSGGCTLDAMIHLFDLLRWYFGEVESIHAEGLLLSPDLPEPMDHTFANLHFKNDFFCSVEQAWIRSGVPVNSLYLVGTEGTIYYDNFCNLIKVFSKESNFEEEKKDEESGYFLEIKTFIQCLVNKIPFFPSFKDAVESLKIALSAIESIQKRKIVWLQKNRREVKMK